MSSKTLNSSLLLISVKFIERFIGILSTLILARILVPEDFGLVAIILLTLSFFESVTAAGIEQYIIQKDTVSESDLNTAWTLDIVLKSLMAILLIIIASFIAEFYQNSKITAPMQAMSVILLLKATINPEIYLFKKANQYRFIFHLSIAQKVIMASSTLTIAVVYESFWALVVGHLTSASVFLIGSYFICDHRPKFSFSNLSEQLVFSKWSLLKSIFGYGRSVIDTILVGRIYDVAALGAYHNMKYLSAMPYTQLIEPAAAPLLATFSSEKASMAKTQYFFNISLFMVTAFGFPLCLFSFLYSTEIVAILLGEQWSEYSVLFGIFALFIFSLSIGAICSGLCLSRGHIKTLFAYDLVSFCMVIITLFLTSGLSLELFAFWRTLVSLISALVFLLVVSRKYNLSLFSFLANLGKIFGILAVCFTLCYALEVLSPKGSFLWAIIEMAVFLTTYCLLFFLLIFVDKSEGSTYIRLKVSPIFGILK